MKISSLQELFVHTLQDVYYAEKQILKALPGMASKATSPDLRNAFTKHEAETQGQVERLEAVFESLGETAKGVKCHAIEGILKEGTEVMKDCDDDQTRDAGMIAAAQAVEHYEITRYGTLVSWAQTLGLTDAARILEQTLNEEKATDVNLTALAEPMLNSMAVA